jgi:hypothetical protein
VSFAPFRRRRLAWAWLALPALLLRALIPPGFMPVAAGPGFALEFCPGAAALPPGLAHAAGHAHRHHHGGSGQPSDPSSSHHAPCLFAASATLAPAPVLAEPLAAAPAGQAAGAHIRDGQLFSPTILRTQSPRGPPVPVPV